MQRLNLTGQRFGKLTAISVADITSTGQSMWLCRCDCGKEKVIFIGNIRSGKQTSCGCSRKGNINSMKHGHNRNAKPSRTYKSWIAMISRCYRVNDCHYPNYAGRGITVCDRWRNSFENFLADMGERPEGLSLDRFPDNDGSYFLENCRWATPKEQANNRRKRKKLEDN